MGLFSYLFASDNKRSLMKIEKIVTGALEENCYVLSFEGTCLIVDPGSDFTKIKKAVGEREKVLSNKYIFEKKIIHKNEYTVPARDEVRINVKRL